MSRTASVIARLAEEQIRIYAIVGDGFSSQIQGLNPFIADVIHNSVEYTTNYPLIRSVLSIHCTSRLLNLALQDALDRFAFISQCQSDVMALARTRRRREYRHIIGVKCRTYSATRRCHADLLRCFLARHQEAIVNAGLKIPDEIIGPGVALGPIDITICQFENRAAQFYMRERK
jgi:hypothetical protein